MAGYSTPLRRARGLGSAKHGVGHFIAQRVSAVALVFLVLWAVAAAVGFARAGGDYQAARIFMASPVNAALLVLFVLAGFFHMHIGMQVVIEDYVGGPVAKAATLIGNILICGLGAGLAVVSLLKVAFGAS